jgi:tetratricopeptide (TPR) repeat protein
MSDPPPASGPRRLAAVLLSLLLAVTTGAVYARACANGFVNYDDGPYVTDNPHVRAGLTAEGLAWAFTTTTMGNWHPLTWLSFQLDATLYGSRAWGFHLTNVLFHVGSTLALFAALVGMTGAPWRSGLVAALFALHPLHVESVAWVAERKDALSTFFGMLALLAYLRYVRRPGPSRYLGVAGLFVLSLMAKPMLVTLPCLLLLLDYWPLGRFDADRGATAGPRKRVVAEKIPLLALAAAFSVIALYAQGRGGAVRSLERVPVEARLANALVSYVAYLRKFFWPADLAPFYPHPGSALPFWQVAGAGLLLGAVTALAVWQARRRPYFIVGWLWYLGSLVPVVGIVQVGDQAMADRYTYVPLVGVSLMVSWGLADLATRWQLPPLLPAVGAAALVAACAALTWVQVGYWHDSTSLWEHACGVTPDNYLAQFNLGHALYEEDRLRAAIQHFSESARVRPGFAAAYNNRGRALFRQGRTADAMRDYAEALRLDPDYADAHNNLAIALLETGKSAEAIEHYQAAVRQDPDNPTRHYNLGLALVRRGELEEGIREFAEAIRLRPGFTMAHNNLGLALAQQGRWRQAVAEFTEALRLQPDYALAHVNLAQVLVDSYQPGRSADPGWVEAANREARVLATHPDGRVRNGALAVRLAQQVCEASGGRDPGCLDTLAAAYAEAGRFEEAIAAAQKARALAASAGPPERAHAVEARLRLYQAHQPYREAP